jgi:hypothetical protein
MVMERTKHFHVKVCLYEVERLKRAPEREGHHGLSEADNGEARALLSYATAQMASTILELRNRCGVHDMLVEEPEWPVQQAGVRREELISVNVSYEQMNELARAAVQVSHGKHIDSSLQASFVLGDISLVMYDLAEASRIFSIVALAAADGQVCRNQAQMEMTCSFWTLISAKRNSACSNCKTRLLRMDCRCNIITSCCNHTRLPRSLA